MAKKYKIKIDNKMEAFGEVDFDKKIIKINRKAHIKAKKKALWDIPQKDSTLINTLLHEKMHIAHPKMKERNIRKITREKLIEMSKKIKNRLYGEMS